MQLSSQRISPCLWFDTQAEDAARHYTGIFPDSHLGRITHYPEAGQDLHGKPAGSVLMVEFQLAGRSFAALNGGPGRTFTEAVSFQVYCDDQAEVDHYWATLAEGGEEGPCGWVKDRFGLSWQVVPERLITVLAGDDSAKAARAMQAMMEMGKIDIAAIDRACAA